ncbi:MAG TPA: retroviral-like aspartic protease family protein [Myxococcales bacterium]|nr:retroviral-like aspartic protease family protein [Myxococcales bacterium]
MPRWLLIAPLAVAACLHRPPPSLHSAELVVQRVDGSVRAFVRATVDGEPLALLVDTGAVRSVLPTAFARRHGLGQAARDVDERMIDAHSNVRRVQLASRVPMQFDGEPVGTLDFVVYASDDIPYAILAPQDLVRPGFALVIDLGAGRLHYGREEQQPSPAIAFRGCAGEGPLERNHRVIDVTVNGGKAQLLLDTGASRTVIASSHQAAQSMLDVQRRRSTTRSVTSESDAILLHGVQLDVAGAAFVTSVVAEPIPPGCWDGVLGADVLSSCTIVWGWSALWLSCRAP